jgi:hypothetical protein
LVTQNKKLDLSLASNNECTKNWDSTIYGGRVQVKNYWLELVDNNWAWFKTYYNIDISEKDVPDLELIPTRIYTLDSIALLSINLKSPIHSFLKLDTTKAAFYVIKKNEFVGIIYSAFKNNIWKNGEGYSGIFESVAGKLSDLYFEKKYSFYNVHIYASPSINYRHQFLVYNDGEELKAIKPGGQELLFINEIMELKKFLNINNSSN